MTQRSRNLSSAIILLAVSVYWYVGAADFRPLSKLFPSVVAVVLGAGAILLGVLTLAGNGPVIRMSEGDAGERHMRSGTMIAVLAGWSALVEVLGLLPASLLGVTTMGYLTFRGHQGTWKAVLTAVACLVLFYFMFAWFLNVPFPRGIFR